MTQNSLKKSTMNGFIWMLSGSGIQSIMQFALLIILSRLLEPKEFGIISAALVIINFTKIFSTIGLGPALVQRKVIYNKHISTSFFFSVISAFLFGSLLYISSNTISRFFNIEELAIVLKIMSIVFLLEGLSKISESLIQRELLFNLLVRIQVISYLFYGIVGSVLAMLGFGVWSLVIAYITQMFIKAMLSLYLQPYKLSIGFCYRSFKELLYFSGGYSLTQISSEFTREGDNFIVAKFLGADSLGLYSRAYQLMVTPANLLGKVLDKVLFPVISKIQENQQKISYLYEEGVRLTTTMMLPGSVFLAIHAESIILLLFGNQWIDLKVPFQILALSLLFRSSHKISDTIAKAKGAVYFRTLINWFYAIMIILFSYIGQFFGLEGVAVGVAIAIMINYILMSFFAKRLSGINLRNLFNAHLGGVLISFIIIVAYILTNNFIEAFVTHFIYRLLIWILIFIIVNFLCIIVKPYLFIGKEGEIILNKLKDKYINN